MHLLSVILFAVSSNLDNLVVGLSYGLKKVHISLLSSMLIGSITFGGTILSMTLGKKLLPFLPQKAAQLLGSAIILGMGVYGILCFLMKSRQPDCHQDGQLSKPNFSPRSLKVHESIILGMALAVNNIGLGIGASISGLGAIPASAGSLCCSMIFLTVGNHAGKRWLSGFIGRYAEPIASVVMLVLGLYELFS